MLWTAIIPTKSRPELLSKTLSGLERQSLRDFEVVVVCDGEDENTRRLSTTYQASFSLRWVFLSENGGLPAARNVGAAHALGEFLWFLDDDTVPKPDCLAAHDRRQATAGLQATQIVVGSLLLDYERDAHSNAEQFLRRSRDAFQRALEAGLESQFQGDPGDEAVFLGVNCSIARRTFVRFGGFDPELRYVDEEFEFGKRLYRGGAQFKHEPCAVVVHHDTKDLVDYFVGCWKLTAEADIHRVFHKKEPCRTRLLRIFSGTFFGRTKEKLAWYCPATSRGIAELARRIGEETSSKFFFRWWCRLGNSVDYWQAVKAAGYSMDELRGLVSSGAICRAPNKSLSRST